jgi:predicted dehydrogenase
MTDSHKPGVTRREVLQAAGAVAAASALAGVAVPHVHAAEDNTIRIALVGCGGRGTGAAVNAINAKGGPVKIVAMADAFKDRLDHSYGDIKRAVGAKFEKSVDVPEDRKFVGFEAYKHAIDCLRKGDVAIFATPPAFRWVHFSYAINKGLNVFMEKPVTVDGASSRRMLSLAEQSEKLGLKVGVGLMCRHCVARAELLQQLQKGAIGDIMMLQAYRQMGIEGQLPIVMRPKEVNELEYQIRKFHGFLWASGGTYSDFLIHNIDECCWMKGDWPVRAEGSGARHYHTSPRGETTIDQNFDVYSVEYTFTDGTKLMLEGRTMPGCRTRFASYIHGTKGSGIISFNSHSPAKPRLFKGHNFAKADEIWHFGKGDGKDEPDPYQLEWNDLLAAIRENKPYNEVKRGVEASLVTAMGRMAAHTGQVIARDQILNHPDELAPNVDKLAFDLPAPVLAGPDGKYPLPQPGKTKAPYHEYIPAARA